MSTEFLETFDAPYYVVLGHRDCRPVPGVYAKKRPAGITAAFKHLVPIIVVCTNRQDADLIFESLQPVSFGNVAPDDAHMMVYSLQHTPATTIHRQLHVSTPMFAIQVGIEPAIYIGYPWPELKHQIEIEKPRPHWKGYPDGNLSAALTFMLKKPGAKLPLLPTGTSFYPPPPETPTKDPQTPVKELRFDLSDLSISPSQEDANRSSSSARPASPEKRGATSSRASSPSKRSVVAAPTPAATRMNSSTLSSSSSASTSAILRSLPTPYGVGAPEDPLVLMLRRFIRRPDSMGRNDNPRLPPLNFGRRADDMFLRSGVDATDLLAILQVRVHSETVEAFTHHMGLTLGWPTRDAANLWNLLELPEM